MGQTTTILNHDIKQFDKTDPRYTELGFFNLKGYMDSIIQAYTDKQTWTDFDQISFVFSAVRNMGKSYGTWEFIEKEIWEKSNYEWKVAYCRTNKDKLKAARNDFNAKYQGKYYMNETKIFKIELDENGKEMLSKRKEIGAVFGVLNAESYKSVRSEGYHFLFWDEFNENETNKGIYEAWVNVISTVARYNKPFLTVLMANKTNPNNDILIALDVDVRQEDDGEDLVVERPGNIFYVDIAQSTFKHLNQDDLAANVWARFNEETNAYMNKGVFLVPPSANVMSLSKINPTKHLKHYLQFGPNKYEYGTFINPKTNEECSYIHHVRDAEPGYKTLALDILGNMRSKESYKMFDETDYVDFAELLAIRTKNNRLFYTLHATRELIEPFILKWVSFLK